FFFSSRRRHTRSKRDWSSDVCSSDLGHLFTGPAQEATDDQALWMRARGPVPGGQLLHRAVLAYACDQVMLEPIMRRHGIFWLTQIGRASCREGVEAQRVGGRGMTHGT